MYTKQAKKSRVKGTAFIKNKLKFETELSGSLHGKISFELGLKKRAQGNLGEYSRKKNILSANVQMQKNVYPVPRNSKVANVAEAEWRRKNNVKRSTLKNKAEGWRESSALKSMFCSYRGPGFNFLHPHDDS